MLKVASDWLSKLGEIYKKRKDEKSTITDELYVNPDALAPLFVEPDLQPFNPADDEGEEESEFRTPVFNYIEKFILRGKKTDGRHQLFVLGDAGMGKSSLLAMIKLGYVNNFWPSKHMCVIHKLGDRTLDRIYDIRNRDRTILLLDALDEDKSAFNRVKERIIDILKATQNFYRVIITCRTQFFPRTDDPIFWRQDRVQIGGFTYPVKYLSLFSEDQVELYLKKKFKNRRQDIPKARSILEQMEDLSCRPMLLAYVDDLIDTERVYNVYQVYHVLVNAWLDRETRKTVSSVQKSDLLKASVHLARWMFIKGERVASEKNIKELLKETPEISHLKKIDVGGRALLNKNSDGDFRFAHLSFQEYLVVQSLEAGLGWPENARSSEMVSRFIRFASPIKADLSGADLREADLSRANLQSMNLSGANLERTKLKSAYLKNTDLRGAKLIGANLNGADLSGANLSGADLRGADLSSANLRGANLNGSCLKGSCWSGVVSFKFTSIYQVKKAPVGFREIALGMGAIEEYQANYKSTS